MGHLDEQKFEAAIAGCTKCDFKAFEISAYLDRQVSVLAGKGQTNGQWTHDVPKFFDGVYRIQCLGCQTHAFDSPDCPRCHRTDALAEALASTSRLAVPMRCPTCQGPELVVSAFAPAT